MQYLCILQDGDRQAVGHIGQFTLHDW